MANTTGNHGMKYRFLGDTGLLVSCLSFGSWMPVDHMMDFDTAYEVFKTAYGHGVNFFDNAESYGQGKSEVLMGQLIQKGIEDGMWEREDLVISTKLMLGTGKTGPNSQGLSRKHVYEGMKGSLKRFGLDYVDLVFCHRPDPYTPMEEIVRGMNYLIDHGYAFYWGTSEWHVTDILEACEIADSLGLCRPLFDQTQYNMLERSRVEYEYAPLYAKYKYGLTAWSPLAGGVLTGKYKDGIPEGSRKTGLFGAYMPNLKENAAKTQKLEPIASEVGCSLAQLALAWCITNDKVSTTILGARSVQQVEENLKAVEFTDKITPDIKSRIDEILDHHPKTLPRYNYNFPPLAIRNKYAIN